MVKRAVLALLGVALGGVMWALTRDPYREGDERTLRAVLQVPDNVQLIEFENGKSSEWFGREGRFHLEGVFEFTAEQLAEYFGGDA